jgi:hypothetical protein
MQLPLTPMGKAGYILLLPICLVFACAQQHSSAPAEAPAQYALEVPGCPSQLSIRVPPGFSRAPAEYAERRASLLRSVSETGYSEVFLMDWAAQDSPQIRVKPMASLAAMQGRISSEQWARMRKEFLRASKAQIDREIAAETSRVDVLTAGAVGAIRADVTPFRETDNGEVIMTVCSAAQLEGRVVVQATGTKIASRGAV